MPNHLPTVFNILVDDNRHNQRGQGIVPAGDEHDSEAQQGAQEGGGPVIIAEPGPPVWSLEEGLKCTRKVDKHVAHQKEPGSGEEGGKERVKNSVCVCVCVCECECV